MLQNNPAQAEKNNRIRQFRNIVGSIVLLFELLFTISLTLLLRIPRTDVDRKLRTLHFVLKVSDDPKIFVRLFHLSFRDFLINAENNQNEFWINEIEMHKKLIFCCFDLLSKTFFFKKNICSLKNASFHRTNIDDRIIEKCLSAEIQYVCRYWIHYLECGKCKIFDQNEVHKFLNQRFLFWIEALSIIERINDIFNIIFSLQNLFEVNQFWSYLWRLLTS